VIAMSETSAAWTSPLLDLLFEEPSFARCLVSPEGRVVRANSEWLRSTGHTLEEVIGRDVSKLLPVTDDTANELLARVRAGQRVEIPRHVRVIEGRETWWDGSIAPLRMDGGVGLLVTERELATQVERVPDDAVALGDATRFQLLVDSVQDYAIFMLDADGRVATWNPGAERIKGYRAEEIIGQHFSRFYAPEDLERGKPDAELKVASTTGRFEDEGWRVRKDGSRFWASLVITRVADPSGRLLGFAKVTRDLTGRQREEQLIAEKERLAVTLRSIGDAVIATDEAGRVTVFNGVAEQLTGWKPEEALGNPLPRFFNIVNEVTRQPVESPVDRVLGEGIVVGLANHTMLVARDGTERPIADSGAPIRDTHGRVAGVILVFRDQTEERRAEEALRRSEQRLRALADSMPQLAWTAQPDGFIVWYNRRWYDYTGTTPAQMEGWGWQDVHDPATLPLVLQRWKDSIATGSPFEMEFPLRGADGGFRRFLTRVFPVKDDDGKVLHWFGTNTDVTELMEAEEALREASRRKDEFLAVLSHELRNPLAPIRNSMYLLDRAEPTGEQARHAKQVVNRQLAHLTRLLDDLLEVTRITRGMVELRRADLDLGELVRSTAEDYRALMQERGINFTVEVPAAPMFVHSDETRLAQVVGNLLQNAAKFTAAGGDVWVSMIGAGNMAELRVRDSGPGIKPDVLEHIFEPFTQAKQTLARTGGGLGLGLSLVKGLVELHGGRVEVTSEEGHGSEFTVRLPITVPPAVAASDDGSGSMGRHRYRVLVVEDNEDAAQSLAEIVEMFGHEVEIARDGPSALERALAHPPDVVLCDIGLPGMSGYDVARVLRTSHEKGMKLIAVSGYAQPEDVRRASEAGFDGHVAKPPDPAQIERLIG
jgi:PAS domain S-box-containing protein